MSLKELASTVSVEHFLTLEDIIPTKEGKFLNMYEAIYKRADGHIKKYELISRNKGLTVESFLNKPEICDAIGIIAFNEKKDKILLQKENRLACGDWVYNFPSGLIEDDESMREAAARELREETGLELVQVEKWLYNAYTAVGLSDERVNTVICTAKGEIKPSELEDEEIEAAWYTKEEVLELIEKRVPMSLRTQSFLWAWATF